MIQISSTSSLPKAYSTSSIWVLKKAAFEIFSSSAVFAPRQKRAPLISIPIKFLSGYRLAKPIVYYPLPQPNSKIIGLSFLKKSVFHFPFNSKISFTNPSLVG